MKETPVHLIRSLVSKIHPPIALSEKESNRLLSTLKASFRHQLDQEHPRVGYVYTEPPKRRHGLVSNLDAPNRHLASVLTNPLIATGRDTQAGSTTVISSGKLTLHDLRQITSDFERDVSRGHATLGTAETCLIELRSSGPSLNDIRSVKPGLRVLRWLHSNALGPHELLLCDRKDFLRRLCLTMVVEDSEKELWEWAKTQKSRIHSDSSKYLSATEEAKMLRFVIAAHARRATGGSLGRATSSFLDAVEARRHLPFENALAILRPAGTSLCNAIAASSPLQLRLAFTHGLYDRLIDSCTAWQRSNPLSPLPYRAALLKLHHPFVAEPKDALLFIRYIVGQKPSWLSSSGQQKQQVHDFLCRTALVLQVQGSHDDAAWVMEVIQHTSPDDFSIERGAGDVSGRNIETKTTKSDDSSHHTLEALNWRTPAPG